MSDPLFRAPKSPMTAYAIAHEILGYTKYTAMGMVYLPAKSVEDATTIIQAAIDAAVDAERLIKEASK
jgi:hypothetical protein